MQWGESVASFRQKPFCQQMKVFSLWWLWSPPFSFFSTSFVTPSQLYPLSNVDLCSTKINHRNKCRTQIIHLNELLSVTHKSMFELKYKLSVNSVLHNLEICQIQLIYYVLDKVWLEFYLMLSATSIRLLNTNFDCFQVWYGSKVLSQSHRFLGSLLCKNQTVKNSTFLFKSLLSTWRRVLTLQKLGFYYKYY